MVAFNFSQVVRNNITTPAHTLTEKVQVGLVIVAEATYQGIKQVEGYWEAFNFIVKDWTDQELNYPVAKIVQAFIYALPALVLFSTSSHTFSLGFALYSGYKLIQILRNDNTYPSTIKTFPLANGFICTRNASIGILMGTITLNSRYIGFALENTLWAIVSFGAAGAFEVTA